MREIKFRAWHREKKCWLDSVRIYGDGSWSGSVVEERGEVDGYDERECELMQYTGLKDKNGKEIYEGDILKDRYEVSDKEEIDIGVLEVINGCACLKYNDGEHEYYPVYGGLSNYEIIGNIYENPEWVSPSVKG